MKTKWNEWLYFSKADRRVIVFLVGVLTGISLATLLTAIKGGFTGDGVGIPVADSLTHSLQKDTICKPQQRPYYRQTTTQRIETFYFDPNTADSTELLRLGLQPWQVRNIYKYRAKGGKYHRPKDFSKLYGLTKGDYERLLPYIRIADQFKLMSDFPQPKQETKDTITKSYPYSEKFEEGTKVDLTTIDTTTLKKIPGIGSYYAQKIVAYGKQLGGYASIEQLNEIEGLPENVQRWFCMDSLAIVPLYINRMSVEALRRHPYLNFYQSRTIVEHRRKYGPIKELQSLSLYDEFTSKDIERLQPYVCFDE